MLMERIDNTIKESIDTISKPRPTWMTKEQSDIYYEDIERLKMKMECYKELKELPYHIMIEYGETDFEIDNSNKL